MWIISVSLFFILRFLQNFTYPFLFGLALLKLIYMAKANLFSYVNGFHFSHSVPDKKPFCFTLYWLSLKIESYQTLLHAKQRTI